MAFLSPHVDGIWPSCCADAGATGGPVAVGFSEKYAAIIAPWTITGLLGSPVSNNSAMLWLTMFTLRAVFAVP